MSITEAIQKVADEPCPKTWFRPQNFILGRSKGHPERCVCKATNRLWPELSQMCTGSTGSWSCVNGQTEYKEACAVCGSIGGIQGRIPDATLEKVRRICAGLGFPHMEFITGEDPFDIVCFLEQDGAPFEGIIVCGQSTIIYEADGGELQPTMLEASCDALRRVER